MPTDPTAITAARLQLLAPRCDYMAIAPYLDRAARSREIDTPDRVRLWLAHVYVETFGFTRLTECLAYSAARLCAVWPNRFKTPEAAAPYAASPAKLAEMVYGGRMGNASPGDGWRYIGRGGLMRTGRAGYVASQAAFKAQGVEVDFLGAPDLLAANAYAWQDAANFWADSGCNALADEGDHEAIHETILGGIYGHDVDDLESTTKRINGGLTGLAERKLALIRTTAVFPDRP